MANSIGEMDFRISIIVTSFNLHSYLEEAIESVLCQSKAPYEILIADDHSTDGSQDLIRAYEKRYPGLIRGVFQKQNVGIPRNRNTALEMVRGNYVGILDGDDVFLPDKLSLQVEALKENPNSRAAYGNFNIVDSDLNFIAKKWNCQQPSGDIFREVAKLKTGLLRTLIVDYELVKEAGFMDERLPRYDGLWLTIKLATKCEFAYVDKVLLDKRDHTSSDSKQITFEEHLHDLKLIFCDLNPLLDSIDSTEQRKISSVWKDKFAHYEKHLDRYVSARP